jgi:hypothetical protein
LSRIRSIRCAVGGWRCCSSSGAARTWCLCAGAVGGQVTLPHSWTDRSEPALAHRLSVEALADLAAVTRAIEGC